MFIIRNLNLISVQSWTYLPRLSGSSTVTLHQLLKTYGSMSLSVLWPQGLEQYITSSFAGSKELKKQTVEFRIDMREIILGQPHWTTFWPRSIEDFSLDFSFLSSKHHWWFFEAYNVPCSLLTSAIQCTSVQAAVVFLDTSICFSRTMLVLSAPLSPGKNWLKQIALLYIHIFKQWILRSPDHEWSSLSIFSYLFVSKCLSR